MWPKKLIKYDIGVEESDLQCGKINLHENPAYYKY